MRTIRKRRKFHVHKARGGKQCVEVIVINQCESQQRRLIAQVNAYFVPNILRSNKQRSTNIPHERKSPLIRRTFGLLRFHQYKKDTSKPTSTMVVARYFQFETWAITYCTSKKTPLPHVAGKVGLTKKESFRKQMTLISYETLAVSVANRVALSEKFQHLSVLLEYGPWPVKTLRLLLNFVYPTTTTVW